jgi:hypothetical protein
MTIKDRVAALKAEVESVQNDDKDAVNAAVTKLEDELGMLQEALGLSDLDWAKVREATSTTEKELVLAQALRLDDVDPA